MPPVPPVVATVTADAPCRRSCESESRLIVAPNGRHRGISARPWRKGVPKQEAVMAVDVFKRCGCRDPSRRSDWRRHARDWASGAMGRSTSSAWSPQWPGAGAGSDGVAFRPRPRRSRRVMRCCRGHGRSRPLLCGRSASGCGSGGRPEPVSAPPRSGRTPHVDNVLVPHLGSVRLGELTGRQIAAMFTTLAATPNKWGKLP